MAAVICDNYLATTENTVSITSTGTQDNVVNIIDDLLEAEREITNLLAASDAIIEEDADTADNIDSDESGSNCSQNVLYHHLQSTIGGSDVDIDIDSNENEIDSDIASSPRILLNSPSDRGSTISFKMSTASNFDALDSPLVETIEIDVIDKNKNKNNNSNDSCEQKGLQTAGFKDINLDSSESNLECKKKDCDESGSDSSNSSSSTLVNSSKFLSGIAGFALSVRTNAKVEKHKNDIETIGRIEKIKLRERAAKVEMKDLDKIKWKNIKVKRGLRKGSLVFCFVFLVFVVCFVWF